MSFKSCSEQTERIFLESNILDIFKINDYLTAMFMFRYYHLKSLIDEFSNLFVLNNQIYQHSTRNPSKLHKQYIRSNYVKHTVFNTNAEIWNSLESKLRDIKTFITFKKQIKQHFYCTQQIKETHPD